MTQDELALEYDALVKDKVLVKRDDRVLIEIAGRDRASWLHNLTTQQIKALGCGDGQYAFALNVKGRILFDLNVFAREDALWVDLDRSVVPIALKHFDKYVITEDVQINSRADNVTSLALAGPRAAELFIEWGLSHVAKLPLMGHVNVILGGRPVTVARTDFPGVAAFDLFFAVDHAEEVHKILTGLWTASAATVEVQRIEAGIPQWGRELTEEYLPAETRQLQRAVDFQKGCYLGQEVVERMRSRKVVARLLAGVRLDGVQSPLTPCDLTTADGAPAGTLTSTCLSLANRTLIGLGYLRTNLATAGTSLVVSSPHGPIPARVVELPFVNRGA